MGLIGFILWGRGAWYISTYRNLGLNRGISRKDGLEGCMYICNGFGRIRERSFLFVHLQGVQTLELGDGVLKGKL